MSSQKVLQYLLWWFFQYILDHRVKMHWNLSQICPILSQSDPIWSQIRHPWCFIGSKLEKYGTFSDYISVHVFKWFLKKFRICLFWDKTGPYWAQIWHDWYRRTHGQDWSRIGHISDFLWWVFQYISDIRVKMHCNSIYYSPRFIKKGRIYPTFNKVNAILELCFSPSAAAASAAPVVNKLKS